MKVMLVEDERKVSNLIKNSLKNTEFTVDTASDIEELFSNMLSSEYEVIVLDRLLDGVDAINHVKDIKARSPKTKIIILSALSEVEDKVSGLTVGVDDYLGKPFHLTELIARIRALCRRSKTDSLQRDNNLSYEDLLVNLDTQIVKRGVKKIDLTPKEYKLLVYLMRRPNRIVSKTEILNEVWELQYYPESNVLEVAVSHLRNKIDKEYTKQLIHSRKGAGYWFGNASL